MLKVISISHPTFNKDSMSFETVEDRVLVVYSSDRYGDSDYKVTFEDMNTHKIHVLTGSKEIYDFVDANYDNIFCCKSLDKGFKNLDESFRSYLLVRWSYFDLSLLDLLDVDMFSNDNMSGVVCKSHGTIFQLMLDAFKLYPIDNIDYYEFGDSLSKLSRFSIKDGVLYVTKSRNKVVTYRIKNVKRFFGIFTKKIVLER